METLVADITLESDGKPLDPAARNDWIDALEKAKAGKDGKP